MDEYHPQEGMRIQCDEVIHPQEVTEVRVLASIAIANPLLPSSELGAPPPKLLEK